MSGAFKAKFGSRAGTLNFGLKRDVVAETPSGERPEDLNPLDSVPSVATEDLPAKPPKFGSFRRAATEDREATREEDSTPVTDSSLDSPVVPAVKPSARFSSRSSGTINFGLRRPVASVRLIDCELCLVLYMVDE